jgi:ribosomal protein S8
MEFKNVLEEISENIIFCLNKRIKESLVQQDSTRIQLNLFKALKKKGFKSKYNNISDYEF